MISLVIVRFSALASFPMEPPSPNMDAILAKLLLVRPILLASGDKTTLTEYCLGILNATTIPTIAAIPAAFNNSFLAFHNLRA